MSQCTVRKDLSILGKSQACSVQPQNREIERKNESNHVNACWETQFVLLCDVLILCDQLHVGVNVSLFIDSGDYKLTFAMTFVTQCSLWYLRGRNSFLDKKKRQVNMYREPQTVNRHLVVGWGGAVSLFTRTKSQWNVPRSTCSIFLTYSWVQCLNYVGCRRVWRSKSNNKTCFKTLNKGRG